MTNISEFSKAARDLSKNPLGIIALFIVLIYGMATIVVLQGNKLTTYERNVFVWFLVSYPVLVLLIFSWLVSRHSRKLYAPQDFIDQAHWMELQQANAVVAVVKEASKDSPPLHSGNGVVDAGTVKRKQVTKGKGKGSLPS